MIKYPQNIHFQKFQGPADKTFIFSCRPTNKYRALKNRVFTDYMIYKYLLYPEQQKAIKEKLINILDLDSYNSTTLYELDTNTEKQKQIMDLLPDMKKYFSISSCAGINKSDTTKRPLLSILRKVLKTDYEIISSDLRVRDEKGNLLYRTKRYYFHRIVN